MDALFIVVAELLIVPLVLWALIALELTLGVAASVFSVVVGRRSATDALSYSWRAIRRKLLWSLIFVSSALLLADLVLFDSIVTLALGSADDREDLDVGFAYAEGSFILGRIELHQLTLAGVRGDEQDPNARFAVTIDELVVDVDTARLLAAAFAVEELSVSGVRGSFDRLRPSAQAPERAREDRPARTLDVTRMHFDDLQIALRDHTGAEAREVEVTLAELDLGPLTSDSAAFDLLYRSRGRGSVAGCGFSLTSTTAGGAAQTTFELDPLSLASVAEPLERMAGVRARGAAELTVVSRHLDGAPEERVELAVDLRLHELELEPGADASMATQMMLKVADEQLRGLGGELPLRFELAILRSELADARSFAESGVIERVADAIIAALREQLRPRSTPPSPGPSR